MSGASAGERLFGTDTFERAKLLCRLSIDVLECLGSFRRYVTDGIAVGGNMYGAHDSPKSLREAIYQLWSQCHERNVSKGHDVWTLLPMVALANAEHLRRINCGEFFVQTATEAIFRKSPSLETEALRACLWLQPDVSLQAQSDPRWGGPCVSSPSIPDLEPYRDVLLSIQKNLVRWKITVKSLRRLECLIEEEQLRTKRYLLDSENRVPPRTTKAAPVDLPTVTPDNLDAAKQAALNRIERLRRDAEPLTEPTVTLEVDIPKQRATLQTPKCEEKFNLPSDGVARWLKVLADHPDQWIRPDDWGKYGGVDLQGVRSRDKLRSLDAKCPKLGRLIATSKHDGTRFEPEWALKSGQAPRSIANR